MSPTASIGVAPSALRRQRRPGLSSTVSSSSSSSSRAIDSYISIHLYNMFSKLISAIKILYYTQAKGLFYAILHKFLVRRANDLKKTEMVLIANV